VEAKDVDYWEINEAFSVVALANAKVCVSFRFVFSPAFLPPPT
jgi:hypothetical protein